MKKGKLKSTVQFRNPELFNSNIKSVNLDRLLSNLFLRIACNGMEVNLGTKSAISIDILYNWIEKMAVAGTVKFNDMSDAEAKDAIQDWLRSNLLDFVFRGNTVKENVASIRPLHLMSYKVQNRKYNTDYNASCQVFSMLSQNREVMQALARYLDRGWDKSTKSIVDSADLDVDTVGILMLTRNVTERLKPNTEISNIRPVLTAQTALFCDDIRRLLVYADKLPRNVFIDYLRILIGFHLALYLMKLAYLLPKMRAEGKIDINDDWTMVIDMSDSLDSKMSYLAVKDAERLINGLPRYFHVTFEINAIRDKLAREGKPNDLANVLAALKDLNSSDSWFNWSLNSLKDEMAEDDDDRKAIDEKLQYFPSDDYFDKYIHLVEMATGGSNYQYKYHRDFIDRVSMKNTDSKLMADGRSRKHPRRGAMGSKLLETLVQLLVLEPKADGNYTTRSFSIDELANLIRDRYGLIINGADEYRFADAGVDTHAAFLENMEAFKDKLRQIGFYTDLSDACLLQKIRPRYNI